MPGDFFSLLPFLTSFLLHLVPAYSIFSPFMSQQYRCPLLLQFPLVAPIPKQNYNINHVCLHNTGLSLSKGPRHLVPVCP